MGKYDFQEGQINQLKSEKAELKKMVNRRCREIDMHIKNLEHWISTDAGNKPHPTTNNNKER